MRARYDRSCLAFRVHLPLSRPVTRPLLSALVETNIDADGHGSVFVQRCRAIFGTQPILNVFLQALIEQLQKTFILDARTE